MKKILTYAMTFLVFSAVTFAADKTIVVLGHPNYQNSKVNRALIESLPKSEDITIHNIVEIYPDGNVDGEKERKLLESYDRIIFQYPIHWYNMPAVMKNWWDKVFVPGWTNVGGTALRGKEIGVVATAGIPEENLKKLGYTIEDIVKPMELVIKYIGADYIGTVTMIGASQLTDEKLNQAKVEYQNLILKK